AVLVVGDGTDQPAGRCADERTFDGIDAANDRSERSAARRADPSAFQGALALGVAGRTGAERHACRRHQTNQPQLAHDRNSISNADWGIPFREMEHPPLDAPTTGCSKCSAPESIAQVCEWPGRRVTAPDLQVMRSRCR